MPKFKIKKKSTIIDAFQWMTDVVPDWWKGRDAVMVNVETGSAFIPTLNGVCEAKIGDFIIKNVKNEIYPCNQEVFAATYDVIDDVIEQCDNDLEI